jgi:hypothetical protein
MNGPRQDIPIGARQSHLNASERNENVEQIWDMASRLVMQQGKGGQLAIGAQAMPAGQRQLIQVSEALTIPRSELEVLLACLSRSSDCMKKVTDALDFFKRQVEDERKIVLEAVVAVSGMLKIHGR